MTWHAMAGSGRPGGNGMMEELKEGGRGCSLKRVVSVSVGVPELD